jgi:hypothetical protein
MAGFLFFFFPSALNFYAAKKGEKEGKRSGHWSFFIHFGVFNFFFVAKREERKNQT